MKNDKKDPVINNTGHSTVFQRIGNFVCSSCKHQKNCIICPKIFQIFFKTEFQSQITDIGTGKVCDWTRKKEGI